MSRRMTTMLAAGLLTVVAVTGCTADPAGQGSPATSPVGTAPPLPTLDSGTQTLAVACAQVRLLPDAGFQMTDKVMLSRLGVISALALLAQDQDSTLADKATALTKVQQTLAVTYAADGKEFRAALADAKAACR